MQDARFSSAGRLRLAIPALLAVCIVGCGGGGSSGGEPPSGGSGSTGGGSNNPPPEPALRVRATVTGLTGDGLHLQLNGGADLEVNADGQHSFAPTLRRGDLYSVSVAAAPDDPVQRCLVEAARGVADADVNVQVRCADARPSSLLVANYIDTSSIHTGLITLYTPGQSSDVLTPVASYSQPYVVQLYRPMDIADVPYWYSLVSAGSGVSRDAVTGIRLDPQFVGSNIVPGAPFFLAGTGEPFVTRSTDLLVEHPTRRFLYAAGHNLPGLSVFGIDQQTGALTPASGNPMLVEDPNEQLTYFAIHPNGKLALAAFLRVDQQPGPIRSYSIDQTSGALTLVGTLVPPMPIARPHYSFPAGVIRQREFMSSDGRYAHFSLHGAAEDALLTVAMNAATGALSTPTNGRVATPSSASLLARHPFAPFQYYTTASGLRIYRMDDNTGVLSLVGELAGEPRWEAIFDPTGRFLYTAIGDTQFAAYAVDAQSGSLTAVPQTGTEAELTGNIPRWNVDPSGRHLYALALQIGSMGTQERVVHILNIDRETGRLVRSAHSPLRVSSNSYEVLPLEMPDDR